MDILTICIPLIIAIFAMAYPLAINEIGSINSKYGSENLINLFRSEKEWRWFNRVLYLSLTLIAVYVLARVYQINYSWMHAIIWIIFILTICLSICLILFVQKVLLYKSDSLLKSYILSFDTSKKHTYLIDLYIYFIKKDPFNPDVELLQYFQQYYRGKRSIDGNGFVTFEDTEYHLVRKLNAIVLKYPKSELISLQYGVSAGEWLTGRGEYFGRITTRTFSVLWMNLLQAVEHEKPHILYKNWQIAFSNFHMLTRVLPVRNEVEGVQTITNHAAISFRQDERQDYIDFLTAMGGLLYYTNNYSVINQCFFYTLDHPPQYREFLPSTVGYALSLYALFFAGDPNRYSALDLRYPFPEMNAVNHDGEISGNILRYIILTYLRLFTIQSFRVNYDPLAYTGLNANQVESLRIFRDFFRAALVEFYEDKLLLRQLFGYRTLSRDPVRFFDLVVRSYLSE